VTQTTFSSSRILQPARAWHIALSLFVAFMLNLIPTAYWPVVPDWLALTLCFWSVRESRYVGMGWAFLLGLAMDVANGSLLGQHPLAYVAISYAGAAFSRRLLWFPIPLQALQILPILLVAQLFQAGIGFLATSIPVGWDYFLGPCIAAVLWIPLTYLLLLPQYQPVERDENRPI